MNFGVIIAAALGLMAISVALGLLLSYPMMLLWNGCLVPAMVGINEVSWLQMWGLMILINILFKSSSSSTTAKE